MNPSTSTSATPSSSSSARFPNPNVFKPAKNLDQEWLEFTSQMAQGNII